MTQDQAVLWILFIAAGVGLDLIAFQWVRRLRQRNLTPTLLLERALRPVLVRVRQWWAGLPRFRETPRAVSSQDSQSPATGAAETPSPAAPPSDGPTPRAAAEVPPLAVVPDVPMTPAPLPPPTSISTPVTPAPVTLEAPPSLASLPATAGSRVAHVQITADVPEGTSVRITIEALSGQAPSVTQETLAAPPLRVASPAPATQRPILSLAWNRPAWPQAAGLAAWWRARAIPTPVALFSLALGIYLLTHLIGLTRYPIYFFTDEAAHVNFAADFVRDGFRNYEHEFLPTYFVSGAWLNSVSVYVQLIPYLLFGKSVFLTRLVSMLITVLGAAWVGLILKDIFKIRHYWIGVLLISVAPAWFLHARTAFEYIELAAFYAGFLYYYLRYRTDEPRHLYSALVLGALVFYTHGLGQMLMGVTGVFLLISDWTYHFHPQRRPLLIRAAVVGLILLLPYGRYMVTHPSELVDQMRNRASYLTQVNESASDKLMNWAREYIYGLSPEFWFLPDNGRDISRHVMKGYGNLWWPTLPFFLLGLWQVVRRLRSAPHRALLLALLATPIPSTLVAIGVPRMLWFIVPATLITALGLIAVSEWVERQLPRARRWVSPALFVILAGLNGYMTYDALVNGPRWYTDYGLYGMQYGAEQIFGQFIPQRLARDPNVHIVVSPTWANGTDQLVAFFLTPEQAARIEMGTIDDFTFKRRPLDANTLLIMVQNEYNTAVSSPKFKRVTTEEVIPYPDGTPGFYLVHLEYADDVDAQFAAEAAARRQPVTETIELDGETVTVTHPLFGAGLVTHLFDHDPFSVVRGLEANPVIIDVRFPSAHSASTLVLTTGTLPDFTVTLKLYAPGEATPVVYTETYKGLPPDPTVTLNLDQGPAQFNELTLEVHDNTAGDIAAIHIREITWK